MIEILHSTVRNPMPEKATQARTGSWIRVVEPTDQELEELAKTYDLELDLLKDATDLYETPRIEQEGKTAYIFARYCYPEGRSIATEPILTIFTADKLITVQRIDSPILQRLISGSIPVATTQRTKTFLQILGAINYSYDRNIHQINKHIIGIRSKLSKAEIKNEYFIEFIDIEENLNEYLTALQPQAVVLRNLLSGRFLPLYEEDKDLIEDLSLGTNELIDLIKSRVKTISNIRDAYSTIMANNLNRIFKLLTSIGIFVAVPTIVASLYGMNVTLPNADSAYAFWEVLGVATLITVVLVFTFKKLRWL